MQTVYIHLHLTSDTTFGRGDGVAGFVDEEVEHDAATGLPFVRGRTLKGLLVEEYANILFALHAQNSSLCPRLEAMAQFLFGQAGSTRADDAMMHVGAALLPEELRRAVEADVARHTLQSADVLASLTAIRRQTAVDEQTGAPDEGSLRAMRVVLRDTAFVARVDFEREPQPEALALLAACVLALRRAGTGRNRGRGRLRARLWDDQDNDITMEHFTRFQQLVRGAAS